MAESPPMRRPRPWLLFVVGLGCAGAPKPWVGLTPGPPPDAVRLTVRATPVETPLPPGLHPLGLSTDRDGLLYIPPSAGGPVPLLVMLHGAGSSAMNVWAAIRREVTEQPLAVVLPESRRWSWEIRHGDLGADLRFIDAALAKAFRSVSVDPSRVILGGFSAGGAMALSLGPPNGDLFAWILALSSPGMDAVGTVGRPGYYVAHGTADGVVPIGMTSRAVVPVLRATGAVVVYREFEGPHTIDPTVLQEALARVISPP